MQQTIAKKYRRTHSGHYQYRWWLTAQNGDRYAVKKLPKGTPHRTADLIRTTYLNYDGLETAYAIAFDFDAHRADNRWKDADGRLDWTKISAALATHHPKIHAQISHVVRSTGGLGLGLLIAINPLPLQPSTRRNQQVVLNLQSRLIDLFAQLGFGADSGARGIARDLPNFKDTKRLVMENRLAIRRAERASVGIASEIHSYLNELEKSAEPPFRLYNDARAEPGIARLFSWLIGQEAPKENLGLNTLSYFAGDSAMATLKQLLALTGLSERFLRRFLKTPPNWLSVEYVNRQEGWRLCVPLQNDLSKLLDRLEQLASNTKPSRFRAISFSADTLKQPQLVNDGERNAWLTALALIYKWHAYSCKEAARKIGLRMKSIPGYAMSRNCRQAHLIVNAIFRNKTDLIGFSAGLPLPRWIEDDLEFEVLERTGTSGSRRGGAPGGGL